MMRQHSKVSPAFRRVFSDAVTTKRCSPKYLTSQVLSGCHNVDFRCAQNLHISKRLADALERIREVARSGRVVMMRHC